MKTRIRLVGLLGSLLLVACSDDGNPSMGNPDLSMPTTLGGNCPAPTGADVTHAGELTTDETWAAAGGPHLVTADVTVRGGHTLTVEECAVVRVQGHASIVIGGNLPADGTGTLIAKGSYKAASGSDPEILRPVTFTADDQTAWWGSLQVLTTGSADLQVVVIDRGGDTAEGGALFMRGDDNRVNPVRNVAVKLLAVTSSATYAIKVRSSAGFTAASDGIIIDGAGAKGAASGGEDTRYAMYVESPALKTLPPTFSFSNNAKNEILAYAPFTVEVDERFPNIGVPFQLRGSFYIQSKTAGELLTLTIDPGVTLKLGGPLGANPSLRLGDSSGGNLFPVRLVAAGTAALPIKITSGAATQAPGDWATIDWQGGPPSGNVMTQVTVEYGGGDSTTNGFGCGTGDNDSLLLFTEWRPDTAFIQGCTFAHSKAAGIVSGWNSDLSGPDFRTGNTFLDIADTCQISLPKNAAGMCPGNDFTPDCY